MEQGSFSLPVFDFQKLITLWKFKNKKILNYNSFGISTKSKPHSLLNGKKHVRIKKSVQEGRGGRVQIRGTLNKLCIFTKMTSTCFTMNENLSNTSAIISLIGTAIKSRLFFNDFNSAKS